MPLYDAIMSSYLDSNFCGYGDQLIVVDCSPKIPCRCFCHHISAMALRVTRLSSETFSDGGIIVSLSIEKNVSGVNVVIPNTLPTICEG